MSRDSNGPMVRVLYIGREDASHRKVWQDLEEDGFSLRFARTQAAGMRVVEELQPNIVIINAAESNFSGARLCRTLGRRLPGVQRLLIVERKQNSLPPCEQHLVRPFTPKKLGNTLRRLAESTFPHVMQAGPIELDLVTRVVSSALGRHHLTPKQCELLSMLIRHANQVVSRRELMEQIWKTEYLGDTRTLDVHVRWLRERIEPVPKSPEILKTVRGVGYQLVVPGGPTVAIREETEFED